MAYRSTVPVLTRLILQQATRKAYIGEDASIASHMLRAGEVAREQGRAGEVVLACLLHDVGHLIARDNTGGFGVADHARLGACSLRGLGPPERTCRAVDMHVDAKRYLVGSDPLYALSDASNSTLAFQGGAMTDEHERAQFEANPSFDDALAVRRVDEAGKGHDMELREAQETWWSFYPLFRHYVTKS